MSRPAALIAATVVLAFYALLVGVPAGSALPVAGLSLLPPDQPILDLNAHPVLTWSVPGRYQSSWDAYSPTSGYDPNFVRPARWSLNLNGCSSTSKYRITGFEFTIVQAATSWKRTVQTPACQLNLHDILPAQGAYTASLTLHTLGSTAGVSYPTNMVVSIHDILIVSTGDSLASGEGNPDQPKLGSQPARWKDQRCHRSELSGPALAARAIEDADPHTSVTFLSFACSGAEIGNVIDEPYAGQEPIGRTTLLPQTEAVANIVGPSSGRTIDALLVSAGVNDLHFADIIERCASNIVAPWHDSATCVTAGGIAGQLDGLRSKYGRLALTIAVRLPNARGIYLNDYPVNVFEGGGCGHLAFPGVGIDGHEGHVMTQWGEKMNAAISSAATSFAGYRWHLVGGLEAQFAGHAYCSPSGWFVQWEQSITRQGNEKGTAHPNALGHAAIAQRTRASLQLG